MCGFLRSVCKKSFFSAHDSSENGHKKRILLTRPTNLSYEKYVFTYYRQIIQFVHDELSKVSTLEQDMALLAQGEAGSDLPPIKFEFRMAVFYRAEKKKILRSQIILVKKILHILCNCEKVLTDSEESDTDKSKAFTELILKEHQLEKEKRKSIENDTKLTEEQRAEELSKEEEYFYYRRIINATYFQQIKTLILSGDFF